MHALHEHLQCALTRRRNSQDRESVVKTFPILRDTKATHSLSLRQYVTDRPQKFFSREAYEIYFSWLQNRDSTCRASLKLYLEDHHYALDRALLFLREINLEAWHDNSLREGDDFELVRSIDRHVHPTYLRLVEAVATPFLHLIAYFSRKDRGKGTDGLDTWSVVQELASTNTAPLIAPYKHIVRNGIAHGGIAFLQNEIRYRDKKGNEETFCNAAIVRVLDDLLDVCNGVAAAIKTFFALGREHGYSSPRQFLIEELQAETETPWWRIEGCVEAQIGATSQLTIFARPNTYDYNKVMWSAIQSGILAEYFAPGYDRYFISLHSTKCNPGWAAFDGLRLRNLRDSGANEISSYKGILEDGLIMFVPNMWVPRFLNRIETFYLSLCATVPDAVANVYRELGVPRMYTRSSRIHRNSWGAVVNGDVVIDVPNSEEIMSTIRKYRRRIVRVAVSRARRERPWRVAPYLPIAFARISVYARDYRRRHLSSFGLGEDLICTVTLQRMKRVRCPDIIGSTVESDGNWRIAWNRRWLEANCKAACE